MVRKVWSQASGENPAALVRRLIIREAETRSRASVVRRPDLPAAERKRGSCVVVVGDRPQPLRQNGRVCVAHARDIEMCNKMQMYSENRQLFGKEDDFEF